MCVGPEATANQPARARILAAGRFELKRAPPAAKVYSSLSEEDVNLTTAGTEGTEGAQRISNPLCPLRALCVSVVRLNAHRAQG